MFTHVSRRARARWLALALLVAVAALVLSNSAVARPVRSATARLTLPLQASLSRLGNNLRTIFSTVDDLATLRQRNAELEALVASLTIENLRLSEVEAENERLRALLNFANTTPSNSYRGGQVVGRVVSREPGNLVEAVLIDLGERHGIRVGMPVVTERGLVGRVSEVYNTTSRVLLITDSDSMVNAMLQSSRMRGVLRGRANQPPVLDYLPPDQPVAVGDIVLTSGEAGNFPAGIPIGQVVSVEQNDVEMFQRAVVRTTVDFNSLENVLVVTNFVPIPDLPR
ncbi:MAG: rod shape-determining protein MreC [Caldilineales bacterium]|nr:rod shape-determining protein MreC [Caldilineales bacterium]MDW8316980.1 rod shape-determining protein MreC [Anaerolineae bacterium]